MSYKSIAKAMRENPAFTEVFEELGFWNINKDNDQASLAKTLTENPALVGEIEKLGFGNMACVAKNMLKKNMSVETIADVTSLTIEEVEALRDAPDAGAPSVGGSETVAV